MSGPAVLSWRRFNEVLGLTPYWNEDTLKVYFRSRAALRENYCDTSDVRPGTKAPADPAKVKALLGVGASLIANHIHRVCPEVAAVAHLLEREFAARVAANVYCSFKGVQAFQTHFDLHDVFALQVEGEKTWHVYESRADAPVTPLPPGDEVEKWLTTVADGALRSGHEARRHPLSAARPVSRCDDRRAGIAARQLRSDAGHRAGIVQAPGERGRLQSVRSDSICRTRAIRRR